MSAPTPSRDAIVYFARDFLAVEFAKFRAHFADLRRVYITVSDRESQIIAEADPAGEVLCLDLSGPDRGLVHETPAVNLDRFLRHLETAEIQSVVSGVARICQDVTARYDVRFYMDEPVSGYSNWEFNRVFTAAGALCLHFQTSWVPGYLFFCADSAQREPLALNLLSGGGAIAHAHVETRRTGLGRPLYVLSYGMVHQRVKDLLLTTGKIVYRALFRRKAAYIDSDLSPHLTHAKCLLLSLFSRYSSDPADVTGAKYVVFPLHYEPESLLNYFSPYLRQEEIASQILDTLPADYTLILKEHPSQPGALHLSKWKEVRKARRVAILRGDYPAARLMGHRPVVVSIGSTFALEAALAGCPVGVLGDVHFRDAPGVNRLQRPGDWPSLIGMPAVSPDQVADWYGDFHDRYCFKGNIMRDRTNIDNMSALVVALYAAHAARGGEADVPHKAQAR